jgi:hypothetical protein
LKQDNNSRKNSELTSKRAKSRGPVQRDTKEVLAELVGKLKEKLDRKKVAARSAGEEHPSGERPKKHALDNMPRSRISTVRVLTNTGNRSIPW